MSLGKFPDFFLNFSGREMSREILHSYCFKSFRLDVEERQLIHNNIPVQLEPKVFDVLVLLVEHNGHLVEKDELLNTVWADSFVEETNVARAVYTLRKTLGDDGKKNKFIETVAKKGYRFVAEVTEVCEADKRQSAVAVGNQDDANEQLPSANRQLPTDTNPPATASGSDLAQKPKQNNRIILFTVGFLTAIFLIVLMSFNFRSDSATNPNDVKSITVLPLKPITAENREPIYEFGIADSLILKLSSAKGLIVRPLSATRRYADIEQDPITAGREQKTDYVLASNYQIADGKIRVTSQLINVASGQVEEVFKAEQENSGIFSIQDLVAENIGESLLKKLNREPSNLTAKRYTTNEEAYRLYLQGRYLSTQVNARDQKKAIEYFEQAIKLDPNYALAFARMAGAYLRLDILSGEFPNAEKVKEIINKAFELDSDLAEGYVARGQLNLVYEWNLPAAEKDLLRAIELEPNNDTAHWLYALLLAARKQFDEALISIETAQAIDPSATRYMMHRGRILYYARRYDEAVVQHERLVDLEKNAFSNWMQFAYQMKGDEAKAYEIFMKIQERRKSEHLEVYQKTYETSGWQGVRRKRLEFAKLDEQGLGGVFDIAKECALLGEKDQAFEFLNKAVEKRRWLIYTLDVEPAFDNLRGDPRFDELLKHIRF